MGTGLDWDAWIGQEEPPEEEYQESLPPVPPPVFDEVMQARLQNELDLDNKINLLKSKASKDISLPQIVSMNAYPDDIQPDPEVIGGIIRKNQKFMLTGGSKSGKSFFMIELALDIATGSKFLGRFPCSKGKVLYVNLEISEKSFVQRVQHVAKAKGLTPEMYFDNFKMLHMRGRSASLEKMVEALAAQILEEGRNGSPFTFIILDPIYKISDGEENSAKDVSKFCNQIDRIVDITEASAGYVHHHSKGSQAGKRAEDRGSGSGVFARDADALLDITRLEIDAQTREVIRNSMVCKYWMRKLDAIKPTWKEEVLPSVLESASSLDNAYEHLSHDTVYQMKKWREEAQAEFEKFMQEMTPLRVEFTLRDFADPKPVNLFFIYPLHFPDVDDVLVTAKPENPIPGIVKADAPQAKANKRDMVYEAVREILATSDKEYTTYQEIASKINVDRDTVKNNLTQNIDLYRLEGGGRGRGNSVKVFLLEQAENDGK